MVLKIIGILVSFLRMLAPQLKSSESKEGVKELIEAIVGINAISLFMATKLKDGFQFTDATDFYEKVTKDEDFKKIMADAYDNYKKIPEEVKDIDVGEGCEVVAVQLELVPAFIETFKKDEQPSAE